MSKQHEFVISSSLAGQRVDKVLSLLLPKYSRAYLQELIRQGNVLSQKKNLKANSKLIQGDKIVITFPEPIPLELKPEAIDLNILYEDKDFLVVNKPAGLVVHPAIGNRSHTLVNALLAHCHDLSDINGVLRPGIVHRLDKETSGCLVVAKNNEAHRSLAKQFEERTVEKVYQCLVLGKWPFGEKKIEGAIGRHPVHRKKMAVRTSGGKAALTYVKPIQIFKEVSFLEIKLATGRTHQIRVHLTHLGYPILGDKQYGRQKGFFAPRQFLHAAQLGFIHPRTNKKLHFTAPLPQDMQQCLQTLKKA